MFEIKLVISNLRN